MFRPSRHCRAVAILAGLVLGASSRHAFAQVDDEALAGDPVTPSEDQVDDEARASDPVTPSSDQLHDEVLADDPVTPSEDQMDDEALAGDPVTPSGDLAGSDAAVPAAPAFGYGELCGAQASWLF